MQSYSTRSILIFCLAQLLCGTVAKAQSYPYTPFPDSSFNASGRVLLDNFFIFFPGEQLVQPDGKIIVTGYGRHDDPNQDYDGIVARVNADGSIDTGFGTNGYLRIDIDGTLDNVTSACLLPDQTIMLLLSSFNRVILIKLLPNGAYDHSFGNEGIFLVSGDGTEFAEKILLQPDNKMLLLGQQTKKQTIPQGYVRRLNADGSPDASFANNGYAEVVLDANKGLALTAGTLLPDGKLVATGQFSTGTTSGFPVVRLNPNGSFDNTFSNDGKYVKVLGNTLGTAVAGCLAVGTDGMVYVGGYAPTSTETAVCVISIKPDGTANSDFGFLGTVRLSISPFAAANDIIIQDDGKLLIGGYLYVSPTRTYFLHARLKHDGTRDDTFGLPNSPGLFASTLNQVYQVEIILDMDLLPGGHLISTGWLNFSVNQTPTEPTKAMVFRNLMELIVSTTEPSPSIHNTRIFPNPAGNQPLTLEYELDKAADISVSLFNINGERVADPLSQVQRSAGKNREQFELPATLPAGTYIVLLSGEDGIRTLSLIKE